MNHIKRLLFSATMLGLAAVLVAGCGGNAKKNDGKDKKTAHAHPTEGPHGGLLVEWGEEEYHGELLRDKEKKQVAVYIYDGEVEKAVPIEADEITLSITSVEPIVQVPLKAEPQKDDPKGKSSKFVGTHDALGSKEMLKGTVSTKGKINGKSYSGRFDEAKAKQDE